MGSLWSNTSQSVFIGIPVPTDSLVLWLTMFKKHFPLHPLHSIHEHTKGSEKSCNNLICLTLTQYFSTSFEYAVLLCGRRKRCGLNLKGPGYSHCYFVSHVPFRVSPSPSSQIKEPR